MGTSHVRGLESHLLWLVTYGDDEARPSPFWPVLQLWNLGVWPIPAQDGVLMLLAAPVVDGVVPFDPEHPKEPWPRLGQRVMPGPGGRWEAFDAHSRAVSSLGLGPIPGEATTIHGNPPARSIR